MGQCVSFGANVGLADVVGKLLVGLGVRASDTKQDPQESTVYLSALLALKQYVTPI